MTKPKVPWLNVATEPFWHTVCERCGEEETIPLPMEIKVALKWMEYAALKHARCKESS